jgi:hypothetical protein
MTLELHFYSLFNLINELMNLNYIVPIEAYFLVNFHISKKKNILSRQRPMCLNILKGKHFKIFEIVVKI